MAPILLRALILAAVAGPSVVAPAAGEETLPNLVTRRVDGADGRMGLAGWHAGEGAPEGTLLHLVPDDPAFAGALVWQIERPEPDAGRAVAASAAAMGVEAGAEIGRAKLPASVVPEGQAMATVVFEATVGGAPGRIAAFVWWGDEDGQPGGRVTSGVHAFAAPLPAFAALGGQAVPAVLFLGAVTAPDEDMRVEGAFDGQAAADRLAAFAEGWASARFAPAWTPNIQPHDPTAPSVATGCIYTFGCVGGGLPPIRPAW